MQPFRKHTGIAVPLGRGNVDTDQIIPKQFLKRIERTGYENFLFFDWRYTTAGAPDPAFVLNEPKYTGASILIAGANFGCGSSREHAVWALRDYGFRAVIAPSFADIFAINSTKNGIPIIQLDESAVSELMQRAKNTNGYRVTVDLQSQSVADEQGFSTFFNMDDFRRHCLQEGLDEIALTLQHEREISSYENRTASQSHRWPTG
ncbi:MAG: 3-isopropylmalate dehydratase small subunit [Acidobacteriales bacterium]|nr:3-isopropylmalate dehydratase small subunit [Terriglobales bacterium]